MGDIQDDRAALLGIVRTEKVLTVPFALFSGQYSQLRPELFAISITAPQPAIALAGIVAGATVEYAAVVEGE